MWKKVVTQGALIAALTIFTGAMLMFGMLTATAQPVGSRPDQSPPRIDDAALAEVLHLSEQKRAQLENILESERSAMRALNESLRPQRQAIFSATREKLAATLSPDQLQRFDAWCDAHRPPSPEGRNAQNPQISQSEPRSKRKRPAQTQ